MKTSLRLHQELFKGILMKQRSDRFGVHKALWALCFLGFIRSVSGSGVITNCTQADLQAALAGGGTVVFACAGTITLTNTLTVVQDTVVDANGNAVVISGGSAVRLFQVASNVDFGIKGITLADGWVIGPDGPNGDPAPGGQDGVGGGILNQGGHLSLTDCTFTNHFVRGGNAGQDLVNGNGNTGRGGKALGAAIYSLGGSLNVTNCLLASNSASGGVGSMAVIPIMIFGDGGDALGGSIYAEGGTVNLVGVTLTNNSATGGAPGVLCPGNAGRGGNGAGGAIYLSNSVAWMSNSMLWSNRVIGGTPSCAVVNGSGSGDGLGGSLYLSQESSAVVWLCTFAGNFASGGDGNGGRAYPSGSGRGGSVFNAGSLQVWASTFAGGESSGGSQTRSPAPGQGGAIYSSNSLVINGSTFAGNLAVGGNADGGGVGGWTAGAGEGGGVWNSGVLSATNCTFITNRTLGGMNSGATVGPGGPASGGGILVRGGTVLLVNITIAGNRADGTNTVPGVPGPAQGGGLSNTNGTVAIRNSIVANSENGGDVWGTVSDAGYNICSDGTANFSGPGSLNHADPLLDALSNNGGPTATMGLLVGSPARDAIPSGFPSTDQRGIPRPQGPAADIGAFEVSYGAVRLGVEREGNNLSISWMAEAGRSYRLLISTNFSDWMPVSTNSLANSGPIQLLQPLTTTPRSLFRVVTP